MFRYILITLAAALVHMIPCLCVFFLAIYAPTDSKTYPVACCVFMVLGVWSIFKFHKYIQLN